jgi:hypothetical protein
VRCLLTDGSVVHVRELRAADRDAVTALHRDLPDEDHYPRFLAGATDARIADGVLAPGAVTVGAFRNGALLWGGALPARAGRPDPELVVAKLASPRARTRGGVAAGADQTSSRPKPVRAAAGRRARGQPRDAAGAA